MCWGVRHNVSMWRAVSSWPERLARRRLQPAPQRLQRAANLIDSPISICGWGLLNGALWLRGRQAGVPAAKRLGGWRVKIAWQLLTIGLSVCVGLWGSPGRRLAGIGLVNARTGKKASLREALRYAALEAAIRLLQRAAMRLPPFVINRVMGTTPDRLAAARQEHMARIKEAQRAHPGDPHAVQQAFAEISSDISPLSTCLPSLAGAPLSLALSRFNKRLASRSPLKQDLAQQIAGVAMVLVDEQTAKRLEAKLSLAFWRQRR